jgi:hypothetical protein
MKFDLTIPLVALLSVFMTLKFMGHIDWSWWWVLSPLWITLGFVVFLILITFMITLFN